MSSSLKKVLVVQWGCLLKMMRDSKVHKIKSIIAISFWCEVCDVVKLCGKLLLPLLIDVISQPFFNRKIYIHSRKKNEQATLNCWTCWTTQKKHNLYTKFPFSWESYWDQLCKMTSIHSILVQKKNMLFIFMWRHFSNLS